MSKKRREARKKISNRLRTKKIIKKYGNWIAIHSDWTGKIIPDCELTEYDAFAGGWADLWHMCIAELNPIVHRLRLENILYFVQIKEKYGEICVYTNHYWPEIESVLDKYATISAHVCEWCGRPDSPISKGGWVMCKCRICDDKDQKKYGTFKTPYWERYDTDPEHCGIPNTYKYSQFVGDKKIDVTVDISDTVREYRERWERKVNKKQRRRLSMHGLCN